MYLGPTKGYPQATLHTLSHPFGCPALSSQEVHVWSAELQQPNWVLCRLAESLSTDEHRRTRAYRMEKQQLRFVTAQEILHEIIAGYETLCPKKPSFRYGPRGKPELACHG